jgi:hypothetical protein
MRKTTPEKDIELSGLVKITRGFFIEFTNERSKIISKVILEKIEQSLQMNLDEIERNATLFVFFVAKTTKISGI